MTRHLRISMLLILTAVIGCGGGSWTLPTPAPRVPSIPTRVKPDPNLLQSLRLTIIRVAAQAETDEEEQEERETAAQWTREYPGQPVPDSELTTLWREGLSQAFAKNRVQVVQQGGARLELRIRRARGRDYVYDVTVTPSKGHPWNKRYQVDSQAQEPDSEAGPAIVVADLLEDPEFLAAVQGGPLPPNTGIFLSTASR